MTKTDNELLFVRVLLIHGGDPEPDNSDPTTIYSQWHAGVRNTLKELDYKSDMAEYINWLRSKGLHCKRSW